MDSTVKINDNKKAFSIGTLLISSYVINYVLRMLLSIFTPALLKTGLFTVEFIASLSSVYMFFYAAGQLINGFLGDAFSPKKLSTAGIALAGVSCIAFAFVPNDILRVICFAVLGFALSMLRGPFMKIISENTAADHARIIGVFFSFSSFAGPLLASLMAMLFNWKNAFIISGAAAISASVIVYVFLTVLENKKQIIYKHSEKKGIGSVLEVFKIERFAFYLIIACLIEISAAAISFWIPTYFTEGLGFDKDSANFIYSATSVCRSFMPFIALFLFKLSKGKDILLMRIAFIVAGVGFAMLIIPFNRWVNIAVLTVALLAMSCVSSLLWSIHIPSLGKTGRVSSINGVLDCSGYIAAAGANLLFAEIMTGVGWNGLFLWWMCIGIVGIAATFIKK